MSWLFALGLVGVLAAQGGAAAVVSKVVVDAPVEERERLARYSVIETGEPLDPEAVRRSVELIHATGLYSDVRVAIQIGPAGLEVIIRPIPTPRFARIQLPTTVPLTTGQVGEILRLRRGDILWLERVDQAARDVGLALVERGWLEARVSAYTEGPAAESVLVFQVENGPQARVASIEMTAEGVGNQQRELLRGLARPRVGEAFERARSTRAATAMRDELVRLQRWRTAVEAVESYDPATGQMHLHFEVDASPPTFVEFRGAELASSLERRVNRLLREGFVSVDALGEAADEIETELERRGHRSVFVTQREERTPQSLTVVFDIEPGPRSQVASVTVDAAPDGVERVVLQTRSDEPLVEATLEADREALEAYLRSHGHPSPRVETSAAEGGGYVSVVFRIRPGPLVQPLRVEVVNAPPEVELPERIQQPGEPYDVVALSRDREALLTAHRNAGYGAVEVAPRLVEEGPGEFVIVYEVDPGPRTEIDRIVIAGLDETREEVVRRELRVAEGEALSLDRLLETRRRLSALDIFQSIEIHEIDVDAGRRSLIVSAREAPRTLFAYGIGYSEREKLRASLEVTRRNLFGMNRSLSLFGRVSFVGSRVVGTYREPYLLGKQQDLFVSAFREEEDREAFDFVRFGALAQTARNLSGPWSLILRYGYRETRTFNVEVPPEEIDREFLQSTFSGPSTSLVLDTRDDPLEPDGGTFFGTDVELTAKVLGGDSFWRAFSQLSRYKRVHSRVLLALGVRLGVAGTFAGAPGRLPLPDRFFSGGDYGLRGYPVDGVDPTGGNALAYAGFEARIDVVGRLSLGLFTSVGNVYPLVSAFDLSDLREVAGFGLRYNSAFGPIRADWGFKLDRREGESASRFHFTIGHAF